MTLRALSDSATSKNVSSGTPASAARARQRSRTNFLRLELALERRQHAPVEVGQLDLRRVLHDRQLIRLAAWLHALAPDVADAEGEDAFGGHDAEMLGAGEPRQQRAMLLDRIALRHFHRRPEAVVRAGRGRVGRADDDVAGERIVLDHEVERRVELFGRHLPRDERAFGEVRGHQRLPHAADRAGAQHGADALDDGLDVDAGLLGDHADRIAYESLNAILGDRQDPRVDRIGMSNRKVGNGGHSASKIAC